MGSRATTRSNSGHQLLTHSDIRSTRCLAQLHKALWLAVCQTTAHRVCDHMSHLQKMQGVNIGDKKTLLGSVPTKLTLLTLVNISEVLKLNR